MHKKNVLIVSHVSPLSPDNGGTMAIKSHLLMLKGEYNVYVLYESLRASHEETEFLEQFEGITFIPFKNYVPNKSKIKHFIKRFKNVLSRFKNKQQSIIIDDFQSSKFTSLFQLKSKKLVQLILNTIAKYDINVVEIHFIQWADLVYAIPEYVKTIFVHHEVRSLRLRTQIDALPQNVAQQNISFIAYVKRLVDAQEKVLLDAFDRVVLLSNYDRQFLTSELKMSRQFDVVYPPIYHQPPKDYLENYFNEPKLWFVGGADHPPNRDGIFWLMRMIAQCPEEFESFLPVSVTGAWSKQWTTALEEEFGNLVRVDGYVEDFDKHSRNKILICSVRIGSGIRMKLLKAMSIKVPILSTREGAMGIDFTDGENVLFFNDVQSLKDNLKKIKEKRLDLIDLVESAHALYQEQYVFKKVKKDKLDIYNRLLNT